MLRVARERSAAATWVAVMLGFCCQRRATAPATCDAATEVPLKCCRAAREVVDLGAVAAQKGNLNVISDAGVAVLAAYAALRSAALNVYTNVKMITDKAFADAKLKELETLLSGAEGVTEEAYGLVKGKLS